MPGRPRQPLPLANGLEGDELALRKIVTRLAYGKEPVTREQIALWATIVRHWPPVEQPAAGPDHLARPA